MMRTTQDQNKAAMARIEKATREIADTLNGLATEACERLSPPRSVASG